MKDEAERDGSVFLDSDSPPLDDVNRVGYDSCPLFLSLSTVNRKQILESEVCNGSLGDRKLDRHRTSLATAKHYDSHTNKKYSVRFLKFHNKTKEYSFLSIHRRLFYRKKQNK